jgi:hypothetical protein
VPTGSFDLSPVPAAQATQAPPVIVCRYKPGDENPYTILSNVNCLRIDYREGPEPPLARFQYMMDDLAQAALDWPSRFEALWPIDAQGDYVVMTDDRLVVLTQIPPATADDDPQTLVLFDGFAQVPQTDVSAAAQAVSFIAQATPVRLWDKPITTRVQRNADQPGILDGTADVIVELPARFNPADNSLSDFGGYTANAVGLNNYTFDPDTMTPAYPVFIDPVVIERLDPTLISYWYTSDVLKYLIYTEPSPKDAAGNPYVVFPTVGSLDDILGTYAPPDDGTLNSEDAQESNVKVRDYDASNKAAPEAMAEMLRYGGFVMVYTIATDDDGNPKTSMRVVRRDGLSTSAPKPLYLAALGATSLDLAENNVTALHLSRDNNNVINQWTMETDVQQIEITVYLAPLFQPSAGDAATPQKFYKGNLTDVTAAERRMYRWYGADECGDGHQNVRTDTWVTGKSLDLSAIFPPTLATSNIDGTTTPAHPGYCRRYRAGSKTLISKDAEGKPLKAILEMMPSISSEDPELSTVGSDNSSWVTITSGWKLLDDRLGIEVTAPDPEMWHTSSAARASGAAVPTIRGVTWLATPTHDTDFLLRLTTVIDSDTRMDKVTAAKRVASPTKFTRERSADGGDHFQYCSLAVNSRYYQTQKDINGNTCDFTNPLILRDDTAAAKTHAEQLRAAHEFPTLAGSATIPFITDYYQIGDRVKIVQGRNASLQINVGVDQGEAPSYPWITAFAWDFQGDKQSTILQFSDRRGEPQGV